MQNNKLLRLSMIVAWLLIFPIAADEQTDEIAQRNRVLQALDKCYQALAQEQHPHSIDLLASHIERLIGSGSFDFLFFRDQMTRLATALQNKHRPRHALLMKKIEGINSIGYRPFPKGAPDPNDYNQLYQEFKETLRSFQADHRYMTPSADVTKSKAATLMRLLEKIPHVAQTKDWQLWCLLAQSMNGNARAIERLCVWLEATTDAESIQQAREMYALFAFFYHLSYGDNGSAEILSEQNERRLSNIKRHLGIADEKE